MPNRRNDRQRDTTYGNPNTTFVGRQQPGAKKRAKNAPHGNERPSPTHTEDHGPKHVITDRKVNAIDIHETPQFKAQTTAKRTPRHQDTVQSVLDRIRAAAAQRFAAPTYNPVLQDVGQVAAPFDQATQTAQHQAQVNHGLLRQYAAQQQQSVADYSKAAQSDLGAERQQTAADQVAAVLAAKQQQQGQQQNLQAQGVTPDMIAELQATQQGQLGAIQGVGGAANRDIANRQQIQNIDSREQAQSATTQSTLANQGLDNSLAQVLFQLAADKASAVSGANQQNQQAQNEAAQQNYQNQVQSQQSQQDAINNYYSTVAQAKQDDPASLFQTPGRQGVLNWIQNYDTKGRGGVADDILAQVIGDKSITNSADAQKELINQIAAANKAAKAKGKSTGTHQNGINFDTDFLDNLIKRYYSTNGNFRHDKVADLINLVLGQ